MHHDVSADVCVLQKQLAVGTMKTEGSKRRMDVSNEAMMDGGR